MKLNLWSLLFACFVFFGLATHYTVVKGERKNYKILRDTGDKPKFPLNPDEGDIFNPDNKKNEHLNFPTPSNITTEYELDDNLNGFTIKQKVGDMPYREDSYISYEEYMKRKQQDAIKSYWQNKRTNSINQFSGGIIPPLFVGSKLDKIFGGSFVDIRPSGTILLTFGGRYNNIKNPNIPVRAQRQGQFLFDQQLQLNIIGKIGEKLKLTVSYDTKATFDFEQQFKIEYTGFEDDIIKKIEAGNVSLPLSGSLISGGQNLFGIKTQLQFGRLTVTGIASQQRGKRQEATAQAGAQSQTFEKSCDQYEGFKHYFLSHFFRDQYNNAVKQTNQIQSPIFITRLEVYVTSIGNVQTTTVPRDGIALLDLGEPDPAHIYNKTKVSPTLPGGLTVPIPATNHNNLLINQAFIDAIQDPQNSTTYLLNNGFSTLEFEQRFFRQLQPSEYTLNAQLGYISLKAPINNNNLVLAVAYQYTYNGQTYQVGTFAQDVPAAATGGASKNLILKMLQSSQNTYTRIPSWDLMMKNIYSIDAFNISKDNFQLQIVYRDGGSGEGTRTLPTGPNTVKTTPLLQLLNLDQFNQVNTPGADGQFDFIQDVTIDATTGRIIIPCTEPFGDFLAQRFKEAAQKGETGAGDSSRYAYRMLYDSTLTVARTQGAAFNKYFLRGSYKSSNSSEISLNAIQVVQGSVQVKAGGTVLQEGTDYTVDYMLGKVKILNQGILASGQEIKVSYETNSLFAIQNRTLLGTRLEYKIDKNFIIGATAIQQSERPITNRINIGDEPIKNLIWGTDLAYKRESRFMTKMIDKLPLISTKEISSLDIFGEFAQLRPGHPNTKGLGKKGISYIDDFEGSRTPIELLIPPTRWKLASIPANMPNANLNNDLTIGYQRAKLSWYNIDASAFYNTTRIAGINDNDISLNEVRPVFPKEVFPNRDLATGQNAPLPILTLHYDPTRRGHYNYNTDVNPDGTLKNPTQNWAGIMYPINTNTDFEFSNIEYLEFWLMDPFQGFDPTKFTQNGGDLYINIGNMTEDVLKDGQISYENGLPTTQTQNSNIPITTAWGRVTTLKPVVRAFDNTSGAREQQDIGLDGLNDNDERTFFQNYLNTLATNFGTNSLAYQQAFNDPSSDNFDHYLSVSGNDVLARYATFSGLERNSAEPKGSNPNSSTTVPDSEDMNENNTLDQNDDYYEYKVSLRKPDLTVGFNYIVDKITIPDPLSSNNPNMPNGAPVNANWYLVRIPLTDENRATIGNIQDFKSVRFIRMYLKGFDKQVVLRFARLQLVGGQWRRYTLPLTAPGEPKPTDNSSSTLFELGTVNIEENGKRTPVNYLIPPDALRERNFLSPNQNQQNESALSLRVCDLKDGDARGVFRQVVNDLRQYKRIRLWVHAESRIGQPDIQKGDIRAFIRMGVDLTNNYYQYAIDVEPTPFGYYTNPADVWRDRIDFAMEDLNLAKALRDQAGHPKDVPFTTKIGNGYVTVIGTPDLSNIRNIMLGIENPRIPGGDGTSKCAEVWFNELQVTEFNEAPGWAANARANFKLADFATVVGTAGYTGIGFAGVEKKISERNFNESMRYDVNSNINLDKLFPKKWNLVLPMYVSQGEQVINPKFNPLNADVQLSTILAATPEDKRDSTRKAAQTYNKRRSIAFTQIKKNRPTNSTKKPKPWDISNWTGSYSYNDQFDRSPYIEFHTNKHYQGSLVYGFSTTPKSIEPFKKLKIKNQDNPLSAFNFTYMPKSFTSGMTVNRTFDVTKNRKLDAISDIKPQFNKTFTITRNYALQYDVTKSLTLNFTATNTAFVDEPIGYLDSDEKRDSLRNNLIKLGRNTNYNHNITLNYKLPFDKFKPLNFITANYTRNGNFSWTTAPLGNERFGNVINNSVNHQINGQISLIKLYNKSKFLKNVLNPAPKQNKPNNNTFPGKDPKNNSQQNNNNDKDKDKKSEPFELSWEEVGKYLLRTILSIENIDISYTKNQSTTLPGYIPRTKFLGFDTDYQSPLGEFLLGSQIDMRPVAVKNNWLVKETNVVARYSQNTTENLNVRTSVQLFKGFRVNLSGTRNYTVNNSELFRYDTVLADFRGFTPTQNGNFNMSYIAINSAFEGDKIDSKFFKRFSKDRSIISQRLGKENGNSSGNLIFNEYGTFAEEYDEKAQDVLLYAFRGAYGNHKTEKLSLNPFPAIPLPNWQLNYNGLTTLPFFKKRFNTVTLTHSYRCTYGISSFSNNLYYKENEKGATEIESTTGNFYSKYVIPQVAIGEQFAPLIGIDMNWKNNITTKIDYKQDRTLALNLSSYQLNESRNRDIALGLGYRINGAKANIKLFGGSLALKNDIDIRLDITYRNTKVRQRTLDSEQSALLSGNRTIIVKPSIDYMINQRLTIQIFYDRTMLKPFISNQFPSNATNFGVRVRFTLS